jgi:hypothetical protein
MGYWLAKGKKTAGSGGPSDEVQKLNSWGSWGNGVPQLQRPITIRDGNGGSSVPALPRCLRLSCSCLQRDGAAVTSQLDLDLM